MNNTLSKKDIIPITRVYDLLLVVCYILFTVSVTLLPPLNETLLRVILGLPLILFVPGYVFISALFPEKKEFDSLERIALSIGLSICIAAFPGFLFNLYTLWRIAGLCSFFIVRHNIITDGNEWSQKDNRS